MFGVRHNISMMFAGSFFTLLLYEVGIQMYICRVANLKKNLKLRILNTVYDGNELFKLFELFAILIIQNFKLFT